MSELYLHLYAPDSMSRWNDPARLQKEIDAQKKRAEGELQHFCTLEDAPFDVRVFYGLYVR